MSCCEQKKLDFTQIQVDGLRKREKAGRVVTEVLLNSCFHVINNINTSSRFQIKLTKLQQIAGHVAEKDQN